MQKQNAKMQIALKVHRFILHLAIMQDGCKVIPCAFGNKAIVMHYIKKSFFLFIYVFIYVL